MTSTPMTRAGRDLLFVYGTLKRGLPAHRRFCADAIFVTTATVRGRLHLHPDGYPVLVAAPSPFVTSRDWRRIHGEILRLRDAGRTLARIDAYEGVIAGVPGLYRRLLVPVQAAGIRFAWTYAAASSSKVSGLSVLAAESWP